MDTVEYVTSGINPIVAFYKDSRLGVLVTDEEDDWVESRQKEWMFCLDRLVSLKAHGLLEELSSKTSKWGEDVHHYPEMKELITCCLFSVLGAKFNITKHYYSVRIDVADEESQAIVDKYDGFIYWHDEALSAYKGDPEGFKEFLEDFFEVLGDGDSYPDAETIAMRGYYKKEELTEEEEDSIYFWSQILN